jgi:hypothetical protein
MFADGRGARNSQGLARNSKRPFAPLSATRTRRAGTSGLRKVAKPGSTRPRNRPAFSLMPPVDDQVHDEPSETQAIDGNVALMGPDGVSVVLTPDAAFETSRLLEAAEAQGQRVRAQAKETSALFRDKA